jgi:hypothetical protein
VRPVGTGPGSFDLRDVMLLGGAAAAAVLAALVQTAYPQPAIVVAAATIALATLVLGPELIVVAAFLAAFGLVPFVDPDEVLAARLPVWVVGFAIAATTMTLTWLARRTQSAPDVRPAWNLLNAALVVLLVYSGFRLAAAEPLAFPSLAAPFVVLPLCALITYVWLSDRDALEGLRRAMPFGLAVVAAWCVAYLGAGATDCGPCREWVSYDFVNESFLGTAARVYTPGQNVVIVLALLAAAAAIFKPTPLTLGSALLTGATVIAAQSRAQYVAFLVGLALLVAWRASTLRFTSRAALVTAAAVVIVLLVQTPVGERAATGYAELREGSGNPAYRLYQFERAERYFSLFGTGIDARSFRRGFNFDLGVSNTVLTLGFVGAGLQLLVLVIAAVRGLAARSPAGLAVAAVMLLALVARPSLPYLEDGNSSVVLGVVLGVACALPVGRLLPSRGRSSVDLVRARS